VKLKRLAACISIASTLLYMGSCLISLPTNRASVVTNVPMYQQDH